MDFESRAVKIWCVF